MAIITEIDKFDVSPAAINSGERQGGLSMFVRTRNGASTLGVTIESHIHHVDEIIVLFNQCTDNTVAVLAALQDSYGPDKLKLYHYLPRVHPPGSAGHRSTPADHPSSVVAYSNAALMLTTRRWVSKLDDDHLGIDRYLAQLTRDLRHNVYAGDMIACFSGLNLCADDKGELGILAHEPFSGGGDIGFFRADERSHFVHDPRFETFERQHLRRAFAGFIYWHLKYLKPEYGFGNYEIGAGNNPRFARKRAAFMARRDILSLTDFKARFPRLAMTVYRYSPFEKARLIADRWRLLTEGALTDADLDLAREQLRTLHHA